jgi:SAM-dependent methyltransferase
LPASPKQALAGSFGNVAELYDRVRLDYSDEAVDHLCSALGLEADAEVLDLAAGTGRLTRKLAQRFQRVVAVEPNASMRALIDGVESFDGTAEQIPLPDGNVDAVFVGEAFHWFDWPVALAEIARVLRPRGSIGLIWNYWWEVEPAIPYEALELLNARFSESGARNLWDDENWRDGFAGSPFEPLMEETLSERVDVDGARLVELYLTTSSLAVMPSRERDELARELTRLVRGSFTIPVQVVLAWTRLSLP